MKKISVLTFRLTICLGVVWPNLAAATLLTYTFSGVVTEVNLELSGEFSVGESVLYRTTIPASAADINPDPNIGTYETGPVEVLVGDYSATQSQTTLSVSPFRVQSTIDEDITAALIAPTLPPSIALTEINMLLIPLQDFTSAALPTNLELADFDLAGMGLTFDGRLVRTHFTNLQVITEQDGALTYTFTGVVTEVNSELSGEFSVGESVLYRTTIPANAADINPDPNIGTYETGPVEVLVGDYSATQSQTTLSVSPFRVQSTIDEDITAALIAPTLPPSIALTEINMLLIPLQDFTSAALPTNLELADFDLAGMGLTFDGRLVRTHFTSLEVTTTVNPAPEPSTIGLLFAGIFGVGLVRSKYVRLGLADSTDRRNKLIKTLGGCFVV